jgi:hypothetical protein
MRKYSIEITSGRKMFCEDADGIRMVWQTQDLVRSVPAKAAIRPADHQHCRRPKNIRCMEAMARAARRSSSVVSR